MSQCAAILSHTLSGVIEAAACFSGRKCKNSVTNQYMPTPLTLRSRGLSACTSGAASAARLASMHLAFTNGQKSMLLFSTMVIGSVYVSRHSSADYHIISCPVSVLPEQPRRSTLWRTKIRSAVGTSPGLTAAPARACRSSMKMSNLYNSP